MKIFEQEDCKVNFVDENNVFVGYDLAQDCCEDAGWFIADKIVGYDYDGNTDNLKTPDVCDYTFDKFFFEQVESASLDEGGQVAFRLTAKNKSDLYLNIYNCHNGYYCHCFEVKHGGEVVRNECI